MLYSMKKLSTLLIIFQLFLEISGKRMTVRRHIGMRNCREPLNLKTQLANWIQESMEKATIDETVIEEWGPSANSPNEPEICEKSPKAEGNVSVMERALCPWENRVNFEETREPKILSESVCLCRKSRGSTGAFCMPIVRKLPILRRISCDQSTGFWTYVRTTETIVVGCHSVLPRTKRVQRLALFFDSNVPL